MTERTLSSLIKEQEPPPPPSYPQSILTGLTRGVITAATLPAQWASLAASLADTITGQHSDSPIDPANVLAKLNELARFGTSEPTDFPHQAIEAAPSVAQYPGLLGKAIGVLPYAVMHHDDLQAMGKSAQEAAQGYGSATAGVETQPIGAPVPAQSVAQATQTPAPSIPIPVPKPSQYTFTPSSQYTFTPSSQFTFTPSQSEDTDRTDEAVSKPLSSWSWQDAALAGITVAGVVAGMAAGVKAYRNNRPVQDTGRTTSVKPPTPSVSDELAPTGLAPGAWLKTQFVDRMDPVRQTLDMAPPGPQKDLAIANVTLSNPQSIDQQVNNFLKVGQFPGSTIKLSKPPVEVFKSISSLPPDEQADFARLTQLNTRIDQSAANDYKPWGIGTTKMDYSDMIAERNSIVTNNPHLIGLADDYHDMFRQVGKYAEQKGVIDAATRAAFETENPNFAPQHRVYDQGPMARFWDSLWGRPRTGGNKTDVSALAFMERDDLTTGAMRPDEATRPLDAASVYFDNLIRQLTINEARRSYADALAKTPNTQLAYTTKPPGPDALATIVYKDGKKQWLIADNQALYSALQYRPRTTVPFMSTFNRVLATTLTGNLNPIAPPKIAQYDAVMGPSMMPEGTKLGPLTELVDSVGANLKTLGLTKRDLQLPASLGRYDPTNLIAPVWGAGKKLWGDMAYDVSQRLNESLSQNGMLVKMLGGRQNTASFAKFMGDAYERSAAAAAERYGVLSSNRYAVVDDRMTAPEILSTLPGFKGLKSSLVHLPGVNIYNAVMDAIKDGQKVQFLSMNIKKVPVWRDYDFQIGSKWFTKSFLAWEPAGDLSKTAAQTRRLMGDPAEIGGDVTTRTGQAFQGLASTVLYGNQSLQVSAQMARMFKDHPKAFVATQLALNYAGVDAWSWALQYPDVKKQLDGMTPEQRSRVIPIAFNNKLWGFIGVPPEMRPIFGAALHSYLALTGHLAKGEFEATPIHVGVADNTQLGTTINNTVDTVANMANQDVRKVALKSIVNDYLPNLDTPLSILAGPLFGKRLDPNSLSLQDPQRDILQESIDPDYKNSVKAYLDNVKHSVAGAPIQAVINATQGFWAARLHNMGVKEPWAKISSSGTALNELQAPFRESKAAGVFNSLWGLGVQGSTSNLAAEKVWRETIPQLKLIVDQGAKQIKAQGSRTFTGTPSPQGMTGLIPDLSNDQQAITKWVAAKQLLSQLQPLQEQYGEFNSQQDNVSTNPIYSDPKKRMVILSEIASRKRALNEQMLSAIRAMEHQTGITFSKGLAAASH